MSSTADQCKTAGFAAMMKEESEWVMGWRNKLPSPAAGVLPADITAELHRSKAAPGTAKTRRGGYVAATGMVLGALAAAALATWYGLGRRRPSGRWREHRRPTGRVPVPHDHSGWGRAG